MVLAIVFGILAAVSLYACWFFVPVAIQAIFPPDTEFLPADVLELVGYKRTYWIGMGLFTVTLTVLFSWLCIRFAKQWRKF